MANAPLDRRFRAGPLTLVAATSLAIILGAAGMCFYGGDAANLLYFFYIPVAGISVVFGKRIGVSSRLWRSSPSRSRPRFVATTRCPGRSSVQREDSHPDGVGRVPAGHGLVGGMGVRERRKSESDTGTGGQGDEAIERERRRTGQDIHDGIAQYAAAAFLETEVLRFNGGREGAGLADAGREGEAAS